MKKNVLLIILGVVTIGCIIFGTYKHVGHTIRLFDNGLIHIDGLYDDDSEEENSGDNEPINQTLEKFSQIKVDTAIAEIRIEEGSEFKLESSFSKAWLKPVVSVENKTLKVTQHKRKNNNGGNNNCKIFITVPAGTKLSDIDIDSNVGDVRLRGISADNIDIDLNVGEISVRDVNFNTIDIDNNVGEVTIDPTDDIKEYDISVSTDVGEVRVDGRSYKRNYNSNGNGKKKIKADTNVGEVNIK